MLVIIVIVSLLLTLKRYLSAGQVLIILYQYVLRKTKELGNDSSITNLKISKKCYYQIA